MRTLLLAMLTVFPLSLPALGQSTPPDSRTLGAILEEIHKLRQDLQTTVAAAERAQILLYRVRLELDTVERLNQRLEQARAHVAQTKSEWNRFTEEKKRIEDGLEQTQDPIRHKDLENTLAAIQNRLEQIKDNEPEAEAKEAVATNELRNEQSKLDDLEERLDRLDKKLEAEQPQRDSPR